MMEHPIETEFDEPIEESFGEVITARAEDVIKPLDDETQEFDFWEDLKDSLPPWIDEVVGFALFVFGILSFISLYFPSEAMVAVAWSDILTNLFGDGGVFVAGTLFGFGVLLWLPKVGIRLRFTAMGLLALEIAFLSALAILHLSNSDVELRALARAGHGGGLVGWGLSYPFNLVIGRQAALAFFLFVVALAIVVVVGVKRRHIVGFLDNVIRSLQAYSRQATLPRRQLTEKDALRLYTRLATSTAYRTQIMRIRPDPEHIPEEIRVRRQSTDKSKVKPVQVPSAGSAPAQEASTAASDAVSSDNGEDATIGSLTDPTELSSVNGSREEEATEPDMQEETDDGQQGRPKSGNVLGLPEPTLLTATELVMPDDEEVGHNVALIENTLLEFDIEINVVDVQVGPTVTRYGLQPHKGRRQRTNPYEQDRILFTGLVPGARGETSAHGDTRAGYQLYGNRSAQ